MKILLVNKFWYLQGGAEQVVFATKKLLEDAGHSVEIFGMQDPRNIYENEYFIPSVDYHAKKGIDKIKVFKNLFYNSSASENFARLLKDFKPDVIHFHNIYHQLSFSLVDVGVNFNIPMVMTAHDYKLISPNYNLFSHGKIDESCLGGKYYNCLLNNCLDNFSWSLAGTAEAYWRSARNYEKKIKYFLAPSDFLKNKFVSAGFKGEIKVLSNPLMMSENLPTATLGDYVFFAGRLIEEKGVKEILTSAKILPEIKFIIAGEGALLQWAKNFVKENNLTNVELVGKLPFNEVLNYLATARLVIAPSKWQEVFGLTIAEAMFMGKTVLASKIGAILELLDSEYLFKPNDSADMAKKIKEWFNKTEEELNLAGEKNKQKIQTKTDSQIYLKNLLAIYAKAIASQKQN